MNPQVGGPVAAVAAADARGEREDGARSEEDVVEERGEVVEGGNKSEPGGMKSGNLT